jgi:hypothetical protein
VNVIAKMMTAAKSRAASVAVMAAVAVEICPSMGGRTGLQKNE